MAQSLPFGIRARARVDYFSSLTTQQLYNTNIYEASRRQRTYGGNVTGNWGGVSVTGNFQRSELFTNDTDSIVNGYAPSITANLSSKRLGRLPLYEPIRVGSDRGIPLVIAEPDSSGTRAFMELAESVMTQLAVAAHKAAIANKGKIPLIQVK